MMHLEGTVGCVLYDNSISPELPDGRVIVHLEGQPTRVLNLTGKRTPPILKGHYVEAEVVLRKSGGDLDTLFACNLTLRESKGGRLLAEYFTQLT